jgi:hypothetical protein
MVGGAGRPMSGRRPLRAAAVRLVAAWCVLSVLGLLAGAPLFRAALPWLEPICAAALPDFASTLRVVEGGPDAVILLSLQALDAVRLGAQVVVQPYERLEASTTLLHNLVPPVLLFTALAALPAGGWRQRLLLFALGVPALALVVALTTPLHLAGLVESSFEAAAATLGVPRPTPFSLRWMLFLEGGGRWLLPILVALGCRGLVAGRAPTTGAT